VAVAPGLTDADAPGARTRRGRAARAGRGTAHSSFGRLRGEIDVRLRLGVSIGGVVFLVGLWVLTSTVWASDGFQVPTIPATADALVEMWQDGELWGDFTASLQRVMIGYSISMVIGVVLGVLMGSFATAEAFLEPQIGFLRYIPASALTPLLLVWLGIDEAPKITLIVVGTVFFNILMTADVARAVPGEMIKASYTLGASRWTVLRRVIFPHSWPGIIDVARINLAAAWLMLVVAELLAAQEGLAFRIIRAQRFRRVDRMFALLLVFGLLGIASDMALRWLRNRTSPWARS
jgi:NitT/TauT family transport system permease protein